MSFFDGLTQKAIVEMPKIRRRGNGGGRSSEFLDAIRNIEEGNFIEMPAIEAANYGLHSDDSKYIDPSDEESFNLACSRLRSRVYAKRDNQFVVGFKPKVITNPENGTIAFYNMSNNS